MDEYLWPARNVAEFAYCPRLFYFMEVEGIHIASADTEKGQAVHRRVDQPSAAAAGDAVAAADPERPRVVRSLVLTSQKHGLTATLDLAEIEGVAAVPVEYRKGRPQLNSVNPPPDDPGECDPPPLAAATPWPTDRVQLGLQCILLEEAGYSVERGVIYYAAEKRRLEVPFDAALRSEALATLQSARTCARGPRPAPLVRDARCLRCSLQPICLPDEIAFEKKPDDIPRRIWPPRDDAVHLVAQQEGLRIGVRGNSLRVTDYDGKLVREIPLANLESLAVLGNVQVSTQALGVLADHRIPLAYMSSAGRLIAMVDPLDSVSSLVRRQQVRRFDDSSTAIQLSRALISAKITNQRTILMRNHPALPDAAAGRLTDLARGAVVCDNAEQLLGIEGQAAAIYFGLFGGIFKAPFSGKFDANGRARRMPPKTRWPCRIFCLMTRPSSAFWATLPRPLATAALYEPSPNCAACCRPPQGGFVTMRPLYMARRWPWLRIILRSRMRPVWAGRARRTDCPQGRCMTCWKPICCPTPPWPDAMPQTLQR